MSPEKKARTQIAGEEWDQRDSIAGKKLALHGAGSGFNPGCPFSSPFQITEFRVRTNLWGSLNVVPKQNKQKGRNLSVILNRHNMKRIDYVFQVVILHLFFCGINIDYVYLKFPYQNKSSSTTQK